jgi:hypothetical protein
VALINTRSKALRERWRIQRSEQAAYISEILKRAGVDLVALSTDGPVVEPLTRLFNTRRRRF